MTSSRLILPFLAILLALTLKCGAPESPDQYKDPPPDPVPIDNIAPVPPPSSLLCPTGSRLSYANFGRAFMLNYCTMCHSATLPVEDRFGATVGVDFDTASDVLRWRVQILAVTTGPNAIMPPGGHVTAEDLTKLREWLDCGAPGASSQTDDQ